MECIAGALLQYKLKCNTLIVCNHIQLFVGKRTCKSLSHGKEPITSIPSVFCKCTDRKNYVGRTVQSV